MGSCFSLINIKRIFFDLSLPPFSTPKSSDIESVNADFKKRFISRIFSGTLRSFISISSTMSFTDAYRVNDLRTAGEPKGVGATIPTLVLPWEILYFSKTFSKCILPKRTSCSLFEIMMPKSTGLFSSEKYNNI